VYVPVNVEIDYKNTGPQNVPANSTQEFVFPAPSGWTGISWGFSSVHPVLEFQDLGFQLNENGQQIFRATVRNPSATDRPLRFTFVLMKV
jgi:hypothetical protein